MALRGRLIGGALAMLAPTLVLVACGGVSAERQEEGSVRYIALGDSYTIGTAVDEAERWPNQLVERVPSLDLVANLGVNGFTSADVIADELPALDAHRPEFMTLLIGVNDVVQGVPEEQYAGNVRTIIEALLERLPADRIVCIATPDYTKTPQGSAFGDPAQQAAAIERANAILRTVCEEHEIAFVAEPHAISREAAGTPEMVADDGLHPSGEQYRQWTDAIAPIVDALLRD
jgi:lysophospholipase L1-like esterase